MHGAGLSPALITEIQKLKSDNLPDLFNPSLSLVSNLIAQPGSSPLPPGAGTEQWVRLSDLGPAAPGFGTGTGTDEIDLLNLWRVLLRRQHLVLVTAVAVVGLSALITTYQRVFKPTYQGSFTLLISDPINAEDKKGGAAAAAGSGSVIEQLARNSTSSDIPNLIELLKSPMLLEPIARRHGTSSADLADQIEIKSGGSKQKEAEGVLNVALTGSDPARAQAVLNDLAKTYLQTALAQRQQRLADGVKFLDLQAPALQKKTADLQQELALFRQRNTVLQPTEEGGALKNKMLQQSDSILALQAERAKLGNVRQAISKGSLTARGYQEAIGGLGQAAGAGNNQGLSVADSNQSLLQQLTKLDEQLAEARAKYTATSSMVKGLEVRRQRLMPMLRQNQLEAVDGALQANAASLLVAVQQQSQLKGSFQGQPQLIKQYEALQQKLLIASDNLVSFLKAKEDFQLEIAQRTVPWKVIAPPEIDPTPIKPSIPRNMALGVILGLVAGAGAGLLRDRLDHVFHSPGEVNLDLNQPLLGHIPHVEFFEGVREDRRFLIEELDPSMTSGSPAIKQLSGYQRFFYQEAFRNLFTSLRFLNSDQPLRSVALTSSIPNEGKTLVNVLLAKTLAEMGKRVLLIDADLRKPQLHYRLGLNNLSGLSNVLAEENCNWRNAIQPVKNYPGWSVLTSGTRPPDPTRLLSSSRMHQMAQEISQSGLFDLVIYDTPPLLGLADAVLVAEHVDGLILLVSLNRVDRQLPKAAINRIRSSGATLLGLVTNAVKQESSGSSAYGYGYGKSKYGYGYGYGYGGYDTSSAYAYYNNDAETTHTEPNDSSKLISPNPEVSPTSLAADKASAPLTWRKQFSNYRKQMARWIDS
jgi:capsular exopolysaccharide synthesis family protein